MRLLVFQSVVMNSLISSAEVFVFEDDVSVDLRVTQASAIPEANEHKAFEQRFVEPRDLVKFAKGI